MSDRDSLRAKMRAAFNGPNSEGSHAVALQSLRKNENTGRIVSIPVSLLSPNPEQPRKEFHAEALANLTSSIREKGVLLPILVREDKTDPNRERHIIIAGERRWRAAQAAGLTEVPALVRSGEDALEVALIENLQRENLKPLEEAEALQKLKNERGYTDEILAQVVGKSRTSITETLALNQLPQKIKAEIQADVERSTLPKSLILQVVRADDPEKMWAAITSGQVTTVRAAKSERIPQTGRPKNFVRHLRPDHGRFRVTVAFSKQHVTGHELKAAIDWALTQLS